MSTGEPQPPTNIQVTEVWVDKATLTWDAPEDDGGQPLVGYVIEKRESDRPVWVKSSNVPVSGKLSAKIGGLFEGSEYLFRIFSVNSVGVSKTAVYTTKGCKARMPFGMLF